jgi:hypothetical protein
MNTDFLKAYEDLSNLQEANNKVTGRFDRPIARGGSWFGINPAYSEDELARIEQDKLVAKEQEKQKLITKYLDKIKTITTAAEAHAFNRLHWRKADRLEYLPLVDAETFEPIYDAEAKKAAVDAMWNWVNTNLDAAEAVAAEIRANGGKAIAVKTNCLDKASIEEAKAVVDKEFGICDILINGAGGNNVGKPFVFGGAGAVFCPSGGGEPSFVNAALFKTQHVIIVGVKLDTLTRTAERSGNPSGFQTQNTIAFSK